ncbi:MAG: glutamate--cysteine ligase [Methylococcales bacterium]|nr:glutamate--cysteine ligase [Methylococcaceae bacterium]
MGQEVRERVYSDADFQRFHHRLIAETELLAKLIDHRVFSKANPVAGFEIEAWLLDDDMRPAPLNDAYLKSFNHPLAGPELAKFNVELNTLPLPIIGDVFSRMHQNLQLTWQQAEQHARQMDLNLLMIGTLPTLQQQDMNLDNMSNMNRFRALNEQILQTRHKPIMLDIPGHEHLKIEHHDVMLEAATTSFQLHVQCPFQLAHHYYNASIMASAAMVGICANSPYLFGKDLWEETRIPIFEQAVASGGYRGASEGPLHRVSFGSDFARHSILECFVENLQHFPVLLAETFNDTAESFRHLRLHNGTIWRWNRPLVGFDADGAPHFRIEHRTPAAGPTVVDMIANAAFYYGLVKNLSDECAAGKANLSFTQAKDNFYQAARHGLDSHVVWFGEHKLRLSTLIEHELLRRADYGLQSLGIAPCDVDDYLDVIRQRVASQHTGSRWQRSYIKQNPGDFAGLTQRYLQLQRQGNPVAEWGL